MFWHSLCKHRDVTINLNTIAFTTWDKNMKNIFKLALGAILALSMGVAQANTLNGNLGIVGLGTVNIDETLGTMTFDPNYFFTVVGTGDLTVFNSALALGTIQDATTGAPVNNFLSVTDGAGSSFTFDLVSLSLSAGNALATGTSTFTDAGGAVSTNSSMVFSLTTQIANSWSAGVPEPTTLAMFGLGLIGLGFAKRKKA